MKIFSELLFIIIAVLVLIILYLMFAKNILSPGFQNLQTKTICIKGSCYNVELAITESQRSRGLMYRPELDKKSGMLFIFEKEGVYPFWMKNTLIPLDIIWINSSNKVVSISHNVQPCKTVLCPSINPGVKAKYVLEINSSESEKMGLQIGDLIDINI